jgi:hypothetical protein
MPKRGREVLRSGPVLMAGLGQGTTNSKLSLEKKKQEEGGYL